MGKYSIGEFEEVVMLTIAVLYNNAYGITIKQEMESRLGRKVSIGSIRTTLKRLENKGMIQSEFGEATAIRGGKRKRFFKVTPYGKQVLDHVLETRQQLWSAIPKKAFDFNFN